MSHWSALRKLTVGCGVLVGLLSAHPVVAALSLETSFSVTGTYTDNLFFANEDAEEDVGTLFGPNLTLLFENPDVKIGATYSGQVSLYVNNSQANRYNQNANIILDLPFLTKQYRGLTVTIDESMSFTPQLDAFSLTEAQNTSNSRGDGAGGGTGGTQGVFTSRSNAFLNRAGVTLGYAWTSRLQTSLAYSNQYRHFFSNGFQDSLRHTGSFSGSYRATKYTTVTSSYSYGQTEFLGKSTQGTSADRIITHSPSLGLTHAFTPSLSGTISAGVSFVKQVGATEQVPVAGGGTQERAVGGKFMTSYIGGVNLTKTFQRGSMGVSANQTIGSGGGLASQATRTRTITGQGDYAVTPRMNAFASVGWAQNDSIGGNALDSITYRVQTGLVYSLTQWLSGNISYSRIDQRSKGTIATDVVVNQVFLSLTAVADPWFLMR